MGVFFLGMGGGFGESGISDFFGVESLLLSSESVLLMIPLFTETVLLGIGGPMKSSSSLKAEFLFPFVRSTVGMCATLGLLSGTRGGVLVGESLTLATLSEDVTDFCLTGTGGGVLELDKACTYTDNRLIRLTCLHTSCRIGSCLLGVTGLGLLATLFSLQTAFKISHTDSNQ